VDLQATAAHRIGLSLTEFNRYARGGWVEDGSAGAHRLLAYGQTLLGAAALKRRLGRPLPFLPRVGVGSGLWRHPEYVPLPVGTGILLHHEVRKQIKLAPRVALIWLWCAGSGADEVTDGVLAAAASTGVDLTPDRVRSTVAKLVERELVVRR
jgi:hypothetical protein